MKRRELSIGICDDEPYFVQTLQKGVAEALQAESLRVHCFANGEDLLASGLDFDILLIDIELPGKNGVETVERLRQRGKSSQVIFISCHQEFALRAFEVDAVQYCIKPVCQQKLARALEKAIALLPPNQGAQGLTIVKDGNTQRILLGDILFCEALDHKIYIHTQNGRYDYCGTLSSLQAKLDENFFRCHKSYIVNLRWVTSKGRDAAQVAGGQQVLVARRRQQELTQRLLAVFRQEVL